MTSINKKSLIAVAMMTILGAPMANAALSGDVVYKDGQYLVNWQSTSPVTIVATQADKPTAQHTLLTNSQTQQFSWTASDAHRHYFELKNTEGDTLTVASRLLPLQGGRNFRDLGGYQTTDGKHVKWGKLYRSGVLSGLTDQDYAFLPRLCENY